MIRGRLMSLSKAYNFGDHWRVFGEQLYSCGKDSRVIVKQ